MTEKRNSALEINPEEFKKIGHQLVDTIADFIATIASKPVTTGESPTQIQAHLGMKPLPENGSSASELVLQALGNNETSKDELNAIKHLIEEAEENLYLASQKSSNPKELEKLEKEVEDSIRLLKIYKKIGQKD